MLSYLTSSAIKELREHIEAYKKAGKTVFVLCDTNTQKHCLPVFQKYFSLDFENNMLVMPAGEANKNIQTATALWQELLDKNADRNSVLICLGGGVVCDMGGFVAATFKRGIEYLFVPTTLMAQVDACIGGKNAVNLGGIKNQIGLFHEPELVFTIIEFLETLPEREILSGFAEMLKHGLIADQVYWRKLIKIHDFSQITQSELIRKSIHIKTAICGVDMFDIGERKKLNFGHSIGHALESFALLEGRDLSHGESVALGMMAEADISCQKNLITENELALITSELSRFFTPFPIENKDYDKILFYLQKDKKKIDNKLNFTLLNAIGKVAINQQVSQNEILQSIENLRKIKA